MALRYGAWRRGGADAAAHGGEIGYFDPHNLPPDAHISLLSVRVYLASQLPSDQPRWVSIAFALPLTSAPLP